MVLGICTDYFVRATRSGGGTDKKLKGKAQVVGSPICAIQEEIDQSVF